LEVYWHFWHDFQHAAEESKEESKSNGTIYQNYGSDIPPMLEVNHANLSGPNREQIAMGSTDHAADVENVIQGNHKFLDPQNQTSTPQACHPSITGNKGSHNF
jgi:hypothetical protein